ncbi:MAG: HipA family kinase [Terracidiphilus sp.]
MTLLYGLQIKGMIQNLTAVQFARFMTSGRTSPALCVCEDESGATVGEYVVKLRSTVQPRGLLNELVGIRLGSHFGLSTPIPALILLEPHLIELIANIEPTKADMVRGSVGQNFGTQKLIGFSTWPVDKPVLEVMRGVAVDIFAFDALVQNPDRIHSNPNLLTKGDTIMAFDHEVAFSFVRDIFPSPEPWKLDRQGYLVNHVFYQQLKAQELDLSRFFANLCRLSIGTLEEIFADVSTEWNHGDQLKISQHLLAVREHVEEFVDEIRRFLA